MYDCENKYSSTELQQEFFDNYSQQFEDLKVLVNKKIELFDHVAGALKS